MKFNEQSKKQFKVKPSIAFFYPLEIEQMFCYDSKHEIEKEKVVEE